MVTETSGPVRRRRRGEQLEAALLAAGWDELIEAGYARLTMESVAVRARTSEAVLYRRWANKDQLVLAAMEHYRDANPVTVPDTGALRTDLLGHLRSVGEARAAFIAVAAAAALSGFLADEGRTPAQIRDRLIGEQPLPHDAVVYRRAHDRGEIDLTRLPSAVLAMPYELVRHDLLMDLKPPGPARIRSIVDDLFLPLAGQHRAADPA